MTASYMPDKESAWYIIYNWGLRLGNTKLFLKTLLQLLVSMMKVHGTTWGYTWLVSYIWTSSRFCIVMVDQRRLETSDDDYNTLQPRV